MMEAVLRFAPAPVLSRFWEAGAQALKTVRNLFAAKLLAANPAREDAQADVNTRAAEILDTHGNAILRYAYSYLHNMEDAEEVLQDTLVQFLKTAPAFESEARKLISCHEIEDGERFVFSFESDFSAFILRLLAQSFRVT